MVVGEPGIGKTRLSDEIASIAVRENVGVFWGRCWEGGGAPVFWPWVQILRAYLAAHDRDTLAAQMQTGAVEIARILPEAAPLLRELSDALGGSRSEESEAARFRLFDAVTSFVDAAAHARPLLFIFDDLHAGDQGSLLLLNFLMRYVRTMPLLVIGTYREPESRQIAGLSHLLGELARESARIFLRGLTEPEVAQFVQTLAGRAPSEALVRTIYEATDGNPFFLQEVVRVLVAEHRFDRTASLTLASLRISDQVREAVRRHLRPVPEDAVRILSTAAVVGRDFDLAVLERVELLGRESADDTAVAASREQLLDLIGMGIDSGVLLEVSLGLGRYRFAHGLLRETLYDDITPARRAQLHRIVGEALEEMHASELDTHLATLAHHFSLAARDGDVGKAVCYLTRAAAQARSSLAYEEEVGYYERALRVLELAGTNADNGRAGAGSGMELLRLLNEARRRASECTGKAVSAAPVSGRDDEFVPASGAQRDEAAREKAIVKPVFRPEGEYWTITYDGATCRLRACRGLSYIAHLIRHPGRQIHALELIASGSSTSCTAKQPREPELGVTRGNDGLQVLDAQARSAYKQRLQELREELEEAETCNDLGRIEGLREQIEFLGHELVRAVGLGGRERRSGSAAERARVNVTRAISIALGRIAKNHPPLARHFTHTIRTGTFCSYAVDPQNSVGWEI